MFVDIFLTSLKFFVYQRAGKLVIEWAQMSPRKRFLESQVHDDEFNDRPGLTKREEQYDT
jgi:hypothetical protein